jgi:hypothetical protein
MVGYEHLSVVTRQLPTAEACSFFGDFGVDGQIED